MTIPDILRRCSVSGVCVAVNGDRLHIDAPKGTVTPEMLALLKEYKHQIIIYLNQHAQHAQGYQGRVGEHLHADDLAATMEAYEERAAIMQHDGGLTKAQAEQQARLIHPP